MIKLLSKVLGMLVLVMAGAAFAQKPCSKADEANAGKAIDRANSWAGLAAAQKSFGHCDSGAIAEQFTEGLLRLIIDWKNIDALAGAMKDESFRNFVYAHLKSDLAKDELPDVYSRAKTKCPKGQEAFCTELADSVKSPAAPPSSAPMVLPPTMTPLGQQPAAPATPPAKK
jgi:hypothetical protein